MSPQGGLISERAVRLESFWIASLVWIGAAIVLYLAAEPPPYPTVFHDEICRLGWARWLSGTGPHYVMGAATYCQPTYPLLLAPLYWLSTDQAEVYRYVFLVNCFLVAASLPLAVRLGLKHFELGMWQAWVAGLAVLAYPSLTLLSHHAWAEPALYPLILVAFIAYGNWIERRDWRNFAGLAVACLAMYMVHRKMLVFPLALSAGVVIGLLYDRSSRYRIRALLFLLSVAAVFLISNQIRLAALGAFWQAADVDVIGRFTRPSPLVFVADLAAKFSGQLVYAALITGGLIWLVLASGAESLINRTRGAHAFLSVFEQKALFAVAAVLMLIIVTGVFFGRGLRFDIWFYGRHIDPALAASLVPAIALIFRGRARPQLAGIVPALVTLVFLVLALTFPVPEWVDYSPVHVLGAGPAMEWLYQAGTRSALLAACALILAGSMIVCLAAVRGRWRFAAILPFVLVTSWTHLSTRPFIGVTAEEAFPGPVSQALHRAAPCNIVWDRRLRGRTTAHQFWRIQYHFPHCAIESTVPEDCDIPGSFLITQERRLDCSDSRDRLFLPPDMVLYPPEGEGT